MKTSFFQFAYCQLFIQIIHLSSALQSVFTPILAAFLCINLLLIPSAQAQEYSVNLDAIAQDRLLLVGGSSIDIPLLVNDSDIIKIHSSDSDLVEVHKHKLIAQKPGEVYISVFYKSSSIGVGVYIFRVKSIALTSCSQ